MPFRRYFLSFLLPTSFFSFLRFIFSFIHFPMLGPHPFLTFPFRSFLINPFPSFFLFFYLPLFLFWIPWWRLDAPLRYSSTSKWNFSVSRYAIARELLSIRNRQCTVKKHKHLYQKHFLYTFCHTRWWW